MSSPGKGFQDQQYDVSSSYWRCAVGKLLMMSASIDISSKISLLGDLFSYIEYKGGKLQDAEAAVIVRQILKAWNTSTTMASPTEI
jgi:hypothetical protein